MNRQEAIRELARGGKRKRAEEIISEAVDQATRGYDMVRAKDTLSDSGKEYELALIYTRANRKLTETLEREARKVTGTDRDDAERVFGTRGIAGDAASLTISRRDAADRVERVEGREELRALLRQATRSGDEVLARAVAERAVREADATTMHQFVADRPDLDEAAERLWNAERADDGTFGTTMLMGAFKPSELALMSDDSIDEIAQVAPSDEKQGASFFQAAGAGTYYMGDANL
ncbi:hypothetical protein ACOACO_18415 [Nocardioides sp. CPCC 205120]|uniref:hypothetical protein n=1 Tax=Nocardioides sp. CPCC 205120 TaxID=3406462 RepID=UPI003B507F14